MMSDCMTGFETDQRILRRWRRMAKQLETVFTTFDRMDTSPSIYIPRSRRKADGITSSAPIRVTDRGIWCCRRLDAHTAPPSSQSDMIIVIEESNWNHSYQIHNRRLILNWNWLRFNKVAFVSLLRSSILCADVTELSNYSTKELFDIYDNTIRWFVDRHEPAYLASVHDRRLICGDRLAWNRQIREMHSFFET